jgi:UDP-N-acetylmuramate: L-alanyl-gamma-D-glutamyl-meso-diaminopimelate ligase
MRVHVLGICGTFMGGLALLARELGHEVSGSDQGAYPPMSELLRDSGIPVNEGYDPKVLDPAPDVLVIGNAFSRGNPMVEYALERGIPYMSGPEFLARHVLQGRWVLAISGTHGKTTTSSMVAWILEHAGLSPGYLIGGAPANFAAPARLGNTPFFVVEADEYDSAFFDKRSKFVHYRPRTLIMNNLEYDHADIFPDLDAIKRQFHHLVRTVPGNGLIVMPSDDEALADVIAAGCWTPVQRFRRGGQPPQAGEWGARLHDRGFTLLEGDEVRGELSWNIPGVHNVDNAIAALLAARHAGVPLAAGLAALAEFRGVRRRLELRGEVHGVRVYDDFAHHPTAIATTIDALRRRVGRNRIIAVLEMRSNTMKMGVHRESLAPALVEADEIILLRSPGLKWSIDEVAAAVGPRCQVLDSVADIVSRIATQAAPGDHVLIMSNGGFEGIHDRLLAALAGHGEI